MRTGVLVWHLTGCSTKERRPYTSTRQYSRSENAGGNIGEQQNVNLKDLTLPLFCYMVAWAPLLSLPVAGGRAVPEVTSWSCLSPTAALSRMAPSPLLGNTVELALVVLDVGELALRV